MNLYNISKKSMDSSKYIEKRYQELIKKGFTPEQAEEMIYFELGTSTVMREGLEYATAEECVLVGRLVGTEIGATVGSLSGAISGFGTGSFVGGIAGSFFGKAACGKIIKTASEKAVQSVSEKLWANNKTPSQEQIDTYYLKAYTADKNCPKKIRDKTLPNKTIR